jgi:uncharacterized membrane protein
MSALVEFVGRLHPLAVHVPIGVLLLLLVAEGVGAKWVTLKLSAGVRLVIVSVAVAGAVTAVGCGWLLAENGSYDAVILDRHRLLGFVTLGLMIVLWWVRERGRVYGFTLGLTVIALSLAGHNGGSLTHGQDYLTSPLQAWLGAEAVDVGPATLAEVRVFDHVIQPILGAKCVSCHGETKSEGELRLDSFDALMAGGKTGQVFEAGDPANSALLQRLFLPLDDKKHMPPAGRPQPTERDMTLLDWWIETGASGTTELATMASDPEIVLLVAQQLGLPPPPIPDRAEMLTLARQLESASGLVVRSLLAEEPWLEVNARLAGKAFGDDELKSLAPIAAAVHRLDLGGTAVTDAGMDALADMKELRRLQLDRTAITDAGLGRLGGLKRIESLSLHTTAVTDFGIANLVNLPKLRRLFVWQTAVTTDATNALAEELENRRKLDRYRTELRTLERLIVSETFQPDFGVEPWESVPVVPEALEAVEDE